MLAAGKRDVALESYAAAEKLLGSDPARRVEVVARRGQALEGMGKDDEAVAEYRRAIKLAPKGYYLEVELTGRIIDIYRAQAGARRSCSRSTRRTGPRAARGHFEWDTLGKLYEETGAQDKAIAALKKAVAKAPWELETQRRLIRCSRTRAATTRRSRSTRRSSAPRPARRGSSSSSPSATGGAARRRRRSTR